MAKNMSVPPSFCFEFPSPNVILDFCSGLFGESHSIDYVSIQSVRTIVASTCRNDFFDSAVKTLHSIINAAEELSQRRIKHLDVLPRPGIVDVLSSLCNACLLENCHICLQWSVYC